MDPHHPAAHASAAYLSPECLPCFLPNCRWPRPAPMSCLAARNPGLATPRQAAQVRRRLAAALPLPRALFGTSSPTRVLAPFLRCRSSRLSLVTTAQHPTAPAQTKPTISCLTSSVLKTPARTSHSHLPRLSRAQWSPTTMLTRRRASIAPTSCVRMPRAACLYKVVASLLFDPFRRPFHLR
jgi:hypothetical protein